MKRIIARIHGIVQGVGFRNFVRRNAENLGITGWVKNNLDGTVEALFEGDDGTISEIIEKCKQGSVLSYVDKVEVQEMEATKEFDNFIILR